MLTAGVALLSAKRPCGNQTFLVLTRLEGITQPKQRKLHGLTLDELAGRNSWSAYSVSYMKNLSVPVDLREIYKLPGRKAGLKATGAPGKFQNMLLY